MKKKIYFVDYSSKDNYGSYVHQIKSNISLDVSCHFFLHSKYKFDSSNTTKLFNHFSDLVKNKLLKKVFVFFEMTLNFLYIFLKLLLEINLEKKIIVSLYQPFITYKFLFFLLKYTNTKICITVHDLIPLKSNYPKFILCDQDSLLKSADMFIVHNEHSRKGLAKYNKNIYYFRFPLLILKPSIPKAKAKCRISILFVGNLRREKGIETLISAWKLFTQENNYAHLTIAGSNGHRLKFDFTGLKNFTYVDEYLSDQKYADLIEECDYGILPYTGGTNSGVLSTFASLNKPVITSDILLFRDSEFSLNELKFETSNSKSLAKLLGDLMIDPYLKINDFNKKIAERVKLHQSKFAFELDECIASIAFDSK